MVEEKYQNALEPASLVNAFMNNPPEGFVISPSLRSEAIHAFFADLDLFTTLDDDAKKIVDKLRKFAPINFIIKKIFTPNVLFIGTTVSEYCCLPNNFNFNDFTDKIRAVFLSSKRQFLIIKDLPQNSPLLTEQENQTSAVLTNHLKNEGFIILTGQALAYLPINFSSLDEYLSKLSASKRKNFRRKMKDASELNLQELSSGDAFFTDEMVAYFYELYLNMYNKSDIHFDKLTILFFRQILQKTTNAKVFIYSHKSKIIGFNICYIVGDMLVDKYAGALYPESLDVALYFNNTFDNIKYCLKHDLKTYIMGWTEPKTKASLGCDFTYTTHAIYIKNPIIRYILSRFSSNFEGDKATLRELEKEE